MDIMSVKEASERWNISERWIQKLCEEGRIEGVQRFGRFWMIPKEAQKPADLRKTEKEGVIFPMYNPQLETFLCVAECGSFNKAAEKLFISPRQSSNRSICWRKIWICSFLCAPIVAFS